MASFLEPTQYQHPALASQLTPPPSPGQQGGGGSGSGEVVAQNTANIGRLRRSKTPEPLALVGSNYDVLAKHFLDQDPTLAPSTRKSSITTRRSGVSSGRISPLSADYEVTEAADVSRPVSRLPTPILKRTGSTPSIPRQRSARQLPISAYSTKSPTFSDFSFKSPPLSTYNLKSPAISNYNLKSLPTSVYSSRVPSRSNTVTAKIASRREGPRLVTVANTKPVKRAASSKQGSVFEKDLPPPPPPPPPRDPSPQRTIMPSVDPDDLPMPEESAKNKQSKIRALRTVHSIGMLYSGPKTEDSSTTECRPTTSKSNRPFHRRLFSGTIFSNNNSSNDGDPVRKVTTPSIYSIETVTPTFTRRLSHFGRRKEPGIEDPLAPVAILPVQTNEEDVQGGLTYLPRYTNNFAGFCKSAWRLQLADPKAIEVKNRNSARQMPSVKCTKCCFEGPLHPERVLGNEYVWAKIPDSKVYHSFGITYTWQFLFKCHIAQKSKKPKTSTATEFSHPLVPPLPRTTKPETDMADGLFGCIFCCVQGSGTPVFKGPEALLWHVRSHANDIIADQEFQHRFHVIVARKPEPKEKFDLHIPKFTNAKEFAASVSVSVAGDGQWEDPSKLIEEYGHIAQLARLPPEQSTVPSTPKARSIKSKAESQRYNDIQKMDETQRLQELQRIQENSLNEEVQRLKVIQKIQDSQLNDEMKRLQDLQKLQESQRKLEIGKAHELPGARALPVELVGSPVPFELEGTPIPMPPRPYATA